MEIWAYKKLLNLPITTPTAALIFECRSLFTSIRVINKQLKYLYTILSLDENESCKKSLLYLVENGFGWGAYIKGILEECELGVSFEDIMNKRKNEWWEIVDNATWQLNCKMLLESCKNRGKVRTKTIRISDFVESGQYEYKRPRTPSLNFQEKL